jgi:hypothetical protein
MILRGLKPFLIGVACWLGAIVGYWLITIGYPDLGVGLVLGCLVAFFYGFYLACKQIGQRWKAPSKRRGSGEDV